MKVILLYWFDAQQQTGTFRRQRCDLFYQKFSVELNDQGRGRGQKIPKTKTVWKNACMRFSESKG